MKRCALDAAQSSNAASTYLDEPGNRSWANRDNLVCLPFNQNLIVADKRRRGSQANGLLQKGEGKG